MSFEISLDQHGRATIEKSSEKRLLSSSGQKFAGVSRLSDFAGVSGIDSGIYEQPCSSACSDGRVSSVGASDEERHVLVK